MACAGSPNASAPATPAPAAPDRSSVVPGPPASLEISPRAARVYREAYVIDMHDDMPSKILDEQYDPDVRHPAGFGAGEGNTDLPRLLESGVTAEFLSALRDARYAQKRPDESYARVLLYLDTIAAFARPDSRGMAKVCGSPSLRWYTERTARYSRHCSSVPVFAM